MSSLTPAQRRFAEESLNGLDVDAACRSARVSPLTLKRWRNEPGWFDKLRLYQWTILQLQLMPLLKKLAEAGEVTQPLARVLELVQPPHTDAPAQKPDPRIPQTFLELAEAAYQTERELAEAGCHCCSMETTTTLNQAIERAQNQIALIESGRSAQVPRHDDPPTAA